MNLTVHFELNKVSSILLIRKLSDKIIIIERLPLRLLVTKNTNKNQSKYIRMFKKTTPEST